MNRRRFIIIGAAFIGVVALVILVSSGRGEPRYQGRALSEWIQDARIADRKSSNGNYALDPKWQAASNAVYHIGTNALPTLVGWAFAKDSNTKTIIVEWLSSHPALHIRLRDAAVWQSIAVYGFELLGDKVEPAWPMIVQHTYSQDAKERWLALNWLQSADMQVRMTRSDGKRVIKTNTLLLLTGLRLFKDPDKDVRHAAALMMAQEYPKEAEAAGVFKSDPSLTRFIPTESATNQSVAK